MRGKMIDSPTDVYSEAYVNGWMAHHDKIAASENPYSEKTQKHSNNEWDLGWCARFGCIKHGNWHPLRVTDDVVG